MANIKASAILTRISEVVAYGLGTARTIPIGTYDDDVPDGLDEREDQRRALATPIVRIRVSKIARSPASPPIYGNFLIYSAEVEIEVKRVVTTGEQLDQDTRQALEAALFQDGDVIRQALEYPGNLTTTAAGDTTDIASGMLTHIDSTHRIDGRVNDGAQAAVGVHRFSGHFFARPS